MSGSQRAFGIDFGTSTSLVTEGKVGTKPQVLPLGRTTTYVPSWVGVTLQGLVVGEAAQDLPLDQIARSVKRAITTRQMYIPLEGSSGRSVDADEAITAVLREVGSRAREFVEIGEDTIRLGCPAMWDGDQRARLLRLAKAAGLPVSDHTLIDEPVAAGVGWVKDRVQNHLENIRGRLLVFDMGGGTLDVALLGVEGEPGRVPEITVLSSVGVNEAGDLLDEQIHQLISTKVALADPSISLDQPLFRAILRNEARLAKEMLSIDHEVMIDANVPGLVVPSVSVSRAELESEFADQLHRSVEVVWSALRMARLTYELGFTVDSTRRVSRDVLAADVHYVLLVGGMSRVPAVSRALSEILPDAQLFDDAGVPADEAVTAGLSEPQSYERINLNRPAFDFVLKWHGNERTIYKANTPLYQGWQVAQQNKLYFEGTVPSTDLPYGEMGELVVRSSSGVEIPLRLDGLPTSGLQVVFGWKPIRVMLYTNGDIIVTDGKKNQERLRVSSWPAIRGADHAALHIERIQNRSEPAPNWANAWAAQHS